MLYAILKAARLRTLPLAITSIGVGLALTQYFSISNPRIAFLILLTALLLQILSNFANDYGDFVKGTDIAANRTDRMLASGKILPHHMLKLIVVTALLTLLSGIYLLYIAFKNGINSGFLGMLILGLVAIAAAITYTVGKSAYGYKAMGDFVVFIFFGPVAVIGTCYLHSLDSSMLIDMYKNPLLVSSSLFSGLLATAVLTINNIRDLDKDKQASKQTIPTLLGLNKAKLYFSLLCIAILLGFNTTVLLLDKSNFITALAAVWSLFFCAFFILKLHQVTEATPRERFNTYLKFFSLLSLLFMFVLWL